MKSNFLSMPVVKEEPKPVVVNEEDAADKENDVVDTNKPSAEEVEEIEKEKKVQRIMSRMNR